TIGSQPGSGAAVHLYDNEADVARKAVDTYIATFRELDAPSSSSSSSSSAASSSAASYVRITSEQKRKAPVKGKGILNRGGGGSNAGDSRKRARDFFGRPLVPASVGNDCDDGGEASGQRAGEPPSAAFTQLLLIVPNSDAQLRQREEFGAHSGMGGF